jgi:YVTN family beta-propeller protein
VLIVTNSAGRAISFVDPQSGQVFQLQVGAAPWGVALAPNDTAYVTTAEGVAVIDTRRRERTRLIGYQAEIGKPDFGEYRPGGMGIAVAPDGSRVYAGVFLPDRSGRLEVIDPARPAVIASVPIGVRPFQVLASRDGREVYTIDHDTFTVTAVDTATYQARTLPVEPLGNSGWGSWDKPHYAALRDDGHLLLPIQGRVLVDLDPASGKSVALPLKANTHQHGVALSPDGRRLLIVGTGPAGDATGQPRLTVLDLATMTEEDIPLSRPHEQVALSPDGRLAYVTGGHSFANGGWDGLSAIDLERRSVTELAVPERPLDIVVAAK